MEKQRLHWKALEVFKAAASEMGIPETDDFNRGNNFGVSYFDVSQRSGWRLNAFQAFIKPIVKNRKNLTVMSNILVDKLDFDRSDVSRCVGVRITDASTGGNHSISVEDGGEVVLSAGSIGSVQILERSGVGDPERLQRLGIPLRAALEGVGENLQDHLQIRASYRVAGLESLNSRAWSPFGLISIGAEYLLNQ